MQEAQEELTALDGGLQTREPDTNGGGQGALDEAALEGNSTADVVLPSHHTSIK